MTYSKVVRFALLFLIPSTAHNSEHHFSSAGTY